MRDCGWGCNRCREIRTRKVPNIDTFKKIQLIMGNNVFLFVWSSGSSFAVGQLQNNLCFLMLILDYFGTFFGLFLIKSHLQSTSNIINPSIPLSVSLPASGLATPPAILACLPPDIWKLHSQESKGDSKILKCARLSLGAELSNKGKKQQVQPQWLTVFCDKLLRTYSTT